MPRVSAVRVPLAALTLLGVSAAIAAGTASSSAAPAATVTLKDISFKKATTRIKAGQSVRFVWADGPYTPHNVTPTGKLRFQRGSTRKTGSYTVRFKKAGTYTFECTIHPNMEGKVVVSRAG